MATGLPIALAMCIGSLLYIWVNGSIPPLTVIHRMVGGIDSFPLLAVPFFIYAGNLMNSAGITNRIFGFALALVGWLKGGLGHVNVVGSVVFAGMSGTAIADAGGLGTIEIKAMQDHGYPTEFAVGITAASSTLGPDHPAVVAVGDLWRAGQRLDRPAVCGRLRAGHPDGHLHDADGHVLRPCPEVRPRYAVLLEPDGPGAGGTACGRDRRRRAVHPVGQPGTGRPAQVRRAAGGGAGRGPADEIRSLHGADDPGHPDRRHGVGPFHADRGGGCRSRLGVVPGLRLVPDAELEDAGQDLDGHHRDHGHRPVHRRRGIAVRLGPHHHPDHRTDRRPRCSA